MSKKNTDKVRDENTQEHNSQINKLTTQLKDHNLALYNLADALEKQIQNKYNNIETTIKK